MEKLIIENRTDLPMKDALYYAIEVVSAGRISGVNKDNYCYLSMFKDGIAVASWKNEKSDRLVVYNTQDDSE